MVSMNIKCFLTIFIILTLTRLSISISIEDVYKRILERERNVDRTFTSQFIKPIGSVGGELIWPRTYSRPSQLYFDENGASFNIPNKRPTMRDIFARTPFGYKSNDITED
uniref:COesterase domain-containing protein n=1 Tax=Rhabditophanes sp. KR3021 TaxID=114890 RepID=A0AC35U5C6_9BILA